MKRIMSSLTDKDEEKAEQKENIERLEMAHIRMVAALRWQITDWQLLQWQRRLKRAAQECDETQLAIEEEKMRQQVSQSSFSKRIAHATKSLLISSFTVEPVIVTTSQAVASFANVQKFERFANVANEFLKRPSSLVERCGGTRSSTLSSDSFLQGSP